MTIIASETVVTDFYNLKNKATGARRYGFIGRIVYEEGHGYRSDFQTTLDGARYQSSKWTGWFQTASDAEASLKRTIAGAIKRYHRLAQDPASKIEYRPVGDPKPVTPAENIHSTTWSKPSTTLDDIDTPAENDKAKKIEQSLLGRFPDLKGKLIVG